ncbi:MAG TPA: hypothetical protein VJQ82_09930 [Terriglobales bacterium]|nr:hypothetical protein [Terriglobales bacterium]
MGKRFWAIVVGYVVLTAVLFAGISVVIANLARELPSLAGKAAAEVQTAYEKAKRDKQP